jgi:hypothetical protein
MHGIAHRNDFATSSDIQNASWKKTQSKLWTGTHRGRRNRVNCHDAPIGYIGYRAGIPIGASDRPNSAAEPSRPRKCKFIFPVRKKGGLSLYQSDPEMASYEGGEKLTPQDEMEMAPLSEWSCRRAFKNLQRGSLPTELL